jgi:hypothetical protein
VSLPDPVYLAIPPEGATRQQLVRLTGLDLSTVQSALTRLSSPRGGHRVVERPRRPLASLWVRVSAPSS